MFVCMVKQNFKYVCVYFFNGGRQKCLKTHKSHLVALGMVDILYFCLPTTSFIFFWSQDLTFPWGTYPSYTLSPVRFRWVFNSPGSRNGHVTQAQPIRSPHSLCYVIGSGSVSTQLGPIRAKKTQTSVSSHHLYCYRRRV